MPETYTNEPEAFKLFYSYSDNLPSAIRKDAWKLHIRIGSQTQNNYGFNASRETPLLFQVENDLGERIDVSAMHPEKVAELQAELAAFEKQLKSEGTFWDANSGI